MKQIAIAVGLLLIPAGCVSTTRSEEMTLAEGAKEVCRSVQTTGSMLPKRECHNQATWAAIDEQNREAGKETMREIQDRWTPVPRESGL